jgi:hypothetical protein
MTARLVPPTTLVNLDLDPDQSMARRPLSPSWILEGKLVKGRADPLTLTLAKVLVIVVIPLLHLEESRKGRAKTEKPKIPKYKMR